MTKTHLGFSAFVSLTVLASGAFAANPMLGADIGVIVARKMFAAPPLPNLDGGGVTVSASYGYVEAKSKLDVVSSNGQPIRSSGGASGNTGGISLSIPTKGDLGYFAFGIANKIKGEAIVTQNGTESYRISNIDADTFALAGGINYRWLGTETSTFALAPFIGPYLMKIDAKSEFVPSAQFGGGSSTRFEVNPTIYGVFEGIQMVLRFGPFRLNPYFLLSHDLSTRCRDVKAEGPEKTYSCSDGTSGKMDVDGTMVGAGMFLGIGPFRLNVFSVIPENLDIEVTHYSGSLSYEF